MVPTLSRDNPRQARLLPDPGGVLYSTNMFLFYTTFFANPKGDWRYILGFEPTLMPEKDLATYRAIFERPLQDRSWAPWIAKLRPADRLAIDTPTQPDLPGLVWTRAGAQLWIGRLPLASESAGDTSP
jgi:hypothetical protein